MLSALKNWDPFWISLGPVIAINGFFFIMLIIFAVTHWKLPHDEELATRHRSRLLNLWFREYWIWSTNPILKLLIRLGISPNGLTTVGFLFSCLAGVALAQGLVGVAGWMIIASGTCDIFDGRIARLSGKMSVSGGFYDSVMDRLGEAVVFLGAAIYFRESWVLYFVIAGLIGSFMVSYTRARGLSEGIKCDSGTMQRPERIVYLGVGSVFSPLVKLAISGGNINAPEYITIAALVLIGVMTNLTALHRIMYIFKKLNEKNPPNFTSQSKLAKSPIITKLRDTIVDSLS